MSGVPGVGPFHEWRQVIRTIEQDRLHPGLDTWEDLRFTGAAINPPGSISDPDFDTSNGGYLFDPSRTEVLYIIPQLPHAWKEGTIIKPYVRWEKTTSAAGNVFWQIRYQWSAYLTARSASTIINEYEPLENSDVADTQMITVLPDIDGDGYNISDIMVMRFERVGGDVNDTYGADARLLAISILYQNDGIGSNAERIK